MCLCTKILKDLVLWALNIWTPPTRNRCMLYVLLLITTDGPALFKSISLRYINFCQCLYYWISDLNIPQGITGHEPLPFQLHYEEFQHLQSPNIM
jgi:hypothetical protein